MKYVTFSFDDGVTQDKRLVELLDKYGLKDRFVLISDHLNRVMKIVNKYGMRPYIWSDMYFRFAFTNTNKRLVFLGSKKSVNINLKEKDLIVITGGFPNNGPVKTTNFLKIERIYPS